MFIIRDAVIGSQQIADTSTTQNHPLGTLVCSNDPTYGEGEFIYLLGVASTVVGSWVNYAPDDFSTSLLTADDEGLVATAMSANVASQWGWYQIKGKAVGKALTGFVDNADVYATSTAGSIDDAVVSGDKVGNVLGASAVDTPSTGLAEFEIDYPNMQAGKIVDGTEVTASGTELNILDGVTASAIELNQYAITVTMADISTASSVWVAAPHAGTIAKISSVINGAITIGDAVITAEIEGTPVTDSSITIATVGSGAGIVDSSTPSAANTVTAGQAIELITDGGSTDVAIATFSILITR